MSSPIRCISGTNSRMIFKINKNNPIIVMIAKITPKKNKDLNIRSAVPECIYLFFSEIKI
ncbi:MAG: hypothetical protein Q8Q23_06480 [bacterium]|nr:hypothetical protein [bacterium]